MFRSLSVTSPTCPACGASDARPFTRGAADAHRRVERPYAFLRCTRCRLRFQTVTTDTAARLYAELEDVADHSAAPARSALRADEDVLAELARRTTGRRLLDVGAGDGYFLEAARRAGFDCVGTDVSERLAETARARAGVPVHVGQLQALGLEAASFDVVNLEQVLMYVPEPRPLLAEVCRLLRPGGIVRVREYDADSLSARAQGRRYWMYSPTRVNVWTRPALEAAARAAGLRIARVYRGTEASLASWLAAERRPGLRTTLKTAAQFAARRVGVGPIAVGADTAFHLEAY